MDGATILSTVIGAVIGGIVNWYFARQGSRELRTESAQLHAESARLRQMVNVLSHALEGTGAIDSARIARDERGELQGIVQHLRAHAIGSSATFGTLTVTQPPPPSVPPDLPGEPSDDAR